VLRGTLLRDPHKLEMVGVLLLVYLSN
jgi:hypothetical protein